MHSTRSRGGKVTSIEPLENRRLLSGGTQIIGEPIIIGGPGLSAVTFTASSGRRTTFSARNLDAAVDFSGSAVPIMYDGSAVFPTGVVETVNSIALTNAVPGKASLVEKSSYGGGLFNIGSISGGSLSAILVPDANLTGSLFVTSVGKLTVGDVSGASINLGSAATAIDIRGVLTGSLTASAIGSLTAYQLYQANITTTASFSKSKLQIGSINASAGIEQSNIVSAGNIGSVTSDFIEDSTILAATTAAAVPGSYPDVTVPEYSTAFTEPAFIGSIHIIPGGTSGFLNQSVIAAETIRSANVGQLGSSDGIAAHVLGSVNAISPAGSLNRVAMHLRASQLKSSTTLRRTLSSESIGYSVGAGLPDNTLIYSLDLNVLR